MRTSDAAKVAGRAGKGPITRPNVRTLVFKFRVSPEERDAIRRNAAGFATPAEFARRRLVGGSKPSIRRVQRVTAAFLPIQELIDRAGALGLNEEAERATGALREILSAVTQA